MANLRKSYDPTTRTYQAIEQALIADVIAVNGETTVTDPQGSIAWPSLSNGQLVAIVRAWKRAAARSKNPAWPEAYDLTIAGLGWTKMGDRFNMTDAHMLAAAPPELLPMVWISIAQLAKRLDSDRTKYAPLILDWERSGYEQAARDAWTEMKRGQAATPAAPAAPAPASNTGGSGAIWLIVLLLAASMARKKRG